MLYGTLTVLRAFANASCQPDLPSQPPCCRCRPAYGLLAGVFISLLVLLVMRPTLNAFGSQIQQAWLGCPATGHQTPLVPSILSQRLTLGSAAKSRRSGCHTDVSTRQRSSRPPALLTAKYPKPASHNRSTSTFPARVYQWHLSPECTPVARAFRLQASLRCR